MKELNVEFHWLIEQFPIDGSNSRAAKPIYVAKEGGKAGTTDDACEARRFGTEKEAATAIPTASVPPAGKCWRATEHGFIG